MCALDRVEKKSECNLTRSQGQCTCPAAVLSTTRQSPCSHPNLRMACYLSNAAAVFIVHPPSILQHHFALDLLQNPPPPLLYQTCIVESQLSSEPDVIFPLCSAVRSRDHRRKIAIATGVLYVGKFPLLGTGHRLTKRTVPPPFPVLYIASPSLVIPIGWGLAAVFGSYVRTKHSHLQQLFREMDRRTRSRRHQPAQRGESACVAAGLLGLLRTPHIVPTSDIGVDGGLLLNSACTSYAGWNQARGVRLKPCNGLSAMVCDDRTSVSLIVII